MSQPAHPSRKRRSGGRQGGKAGRVNWSDAQINALLLAVEKHRPIGSDMWAVAAATFTGITNAQRTGQQLQIKFRKLAQDKGQTGDADHKAHVEKAKRLAWEIDNDVAVQASSLSPPQQQSEDEDDDEDVEQVEDEDENENADDPSPAPVFGVPVSPPAAVTVPAAAASSQQDGSTRLADDIASRTSADLEQQTNTSLLDVAATSQPAGAVTPNLNQPAQQKTGEAPSFTTHAAPDRPPSPQSRHHKQLSSTSSTPSAARQDTSTRQPVSARKMISFFYMTPSKASVPLVRAPPLSSSSARRQQPSPTSRRTGRQHLQRYHRTHQRSHTHDPPRCHLHLLP